MTHEQWQSPILPLDPEIPPTLLKEGNQKRMRRLWTRAIEENTSPSHDYHHLALVLKYADLLYQWSLNQGDCLNWENLFAAVCLHDLGRSDPSLHQQESLEKSLAMAQLILRQAGYQNLYEIEPICQIIREHGQPENIPTSLEAKILKEADFLAGMGAWGIFRTILWAGECGRPVSKIIERLETSMAERMASLKLPLSREISWREWPLTRVFLAHLKEQSRAEEVEIYPGKYLVIEGISGSGKDTQAEMLAEHLRKVYGKKVEIVREPSDLARQTLSLWKQAGEVTSPQRAHLMIADRMGIVERQIKPVLREGAMVIGVRSWLCTMVYQGESDREMAEILLMNHFVPRPDGLIFLKIDPETALSRVDHRLSTEGGKRGDYEEIEKAKKLTLRYEKAIGQLCPGLVIVEVDGLGTPDEVFQRIVNGMAIPSLLSA